MTTAAPKIQALAPWFGSDRNVSKQIAEIVGPAAWVGIPFSGGCSIVPHLKTRAGVANDKHRHVINLARCVSDDAALESLMTRLESLLFHPDVLSEAQRVAATYETTRSGTSGLFATAPTADDYIDIEAAAAFFVCAWMGRSATSGTRGELRGGISTRFSASGGGSCKRYRSAVDSLRAWNRALMGWEFRCDDAFEFLFRCHDRPGHVLYVDAPWPGAGDDYKYPFTVAQQRQLATALVRFEKCRVVVRYGDDPLIRELYPESDGWTWIENPSRDQANQTINEVLIVNKAA